ncbi:MAG: hypothetical protein ACK5LJ_03735 [Paracoccus sp. (in: a-proteobacteria)]
MHNIKLNARKSGRTSKMIEEAIELQNQGRAIYILCTQESIQYIEELAHKICSTKNIELPQSIKFETIQSIGRETIDWKNCSLYGAHPNCRLLIDHYVWEKEFGWAINGFHKYD